MADNAAKKVISPEAIISFPALFEAKPGPDGKNPKFGATLVFPAGADLKPMRRALAAAAEEKWGDKAGEILKGQRNPVFRTDKNEKYGYPEGSVSVNVKSQTQPGVVSTFRGEDGKPQMITDPNKIYSGCFVRASLFAYAYDNSGNKGVTFFLNNVQFIREGERLDGRVSARDEFEATDEPVDLSDLDGEGEDEPPKPAKARKAKAAAPAGDSLEDLLK
jgi:hypothetical protein